jgi:sec-independent protein translocase protein TatB
MIDFGLDKIALIGAVALIVIGPEKLPKVARTMGHLLGKAQRYVSDVKAEVNRSIELDELKKMRTQFEDAARDVGGSVRAEVNQFESDWKTATNDLGHNADGTAVSHDSSSHSGHGNDSLGSALASLPPTYQHPKKKWRLKRGAMPAWYKQRQGIRTKAQSGAARVARFRPPGFKPNSMP